MRILINAVFYGAVGHVVDGLKFARGLYEANPGAKISLALNAATTWQLAQACPWIEAVYRFDVLEEWAQVPPPDLPPDMPQEWDVILSLNLGLRKPAAGDTVEKAEYGLYAVYAAFDKLTTHIGRGTLFPLSLPEPVKYKVESYVRFELPGDIMAAEFPGADATANDFCVMLAGAGRPCWYPGLDAWEEILSALGTRFRTARFYITGVSVYKPGGSATSTWGVEEIEAFAERVPRATVCYNIGLWNQIRLVGQCGIFISPHTGFGWIASCVDTRWLTISGGDFGEGFFNGVPFYSVLPNDPDYPYQERKGLKWIDDHSIEKIPSMTAAALRAKIPEILVGAELLRDPTFDYIEALEVHRANVNRSCVRRDDLCIWPYY